MIIFGTSTEVYCTGQKFLSFPESGYINIFLTIIEAQL